MSISLAILIFIIAFILGIISKFVIKPAWASEYNVAWNDDIGILKKDIVYGENEANKFDLYLPKDNTRNSYGLVVYLHAGGFTSGDKSGDEQILSWLCKKGYVASGINYTLRNEENDASVLSQSNEIKKAIPIVIEEAKKLGYPIDKMAIAGGSAGHSLSGGHGGILRYEGKQCLRDCLRRSVLASCILRGCFFPSEAASPGGGIKEF